MTIERKSVQSSGDQSGHGCPIEMSGIHGNSGELTPGIFQYRKVSKLMEISLHSDPPCLRVVIGVWEYWEYSIVLVNQMLRNYIVFDYTYYIWMVYRSTTIIAWSRCLKMNFIISLEPKWRIINCSRSKSPTTTTCYSIP